MTVKKKGRPLLSDELRVKQRSVRLNDRHYRIYKQCGRDKWLREKLEEAYVVCNPDVS